MSLKSIVGSFLLPVTFMLFTTPCYSNDRTVKPVRQWNGSVSDETLMKDGPASITNEADLKKLWRDWKIVARRPTIDFSKQILVLVTSRGSVLNLVAKVDDAGNLKVMGLGTMDLRPGFRYVLAAVSRAGIISVNGTPLSTVSNPVNGGQNRATVTGNVIYRQRIALPPDAIVEVRLLDVSRADAPAVELAKQEIKPTKQVPIPFSLNYDPSQIEPNHSYTVQAKILMGGKLWATSTARYAVITQGNPTNVEVLVEMVRSRDQ